jgi:hypothetical protein
LNDDNQTKSQRQIKKCRLKGLANLGGSILDLKFIKKIIPAKKMITFILKIAKQVYFLFKMGQVLINF